jgi:rubrerythrin
VAQTRIRERGHVREQTRIEEAEPHGFVEFFTAGSTATGEFQCAECGYGVVVSRALPTCPMCSGAAWERAPWSPLTRALRA